MARKTQRRNGSATCASIPRILCSPATGVAASGCCATLTCGGTAGQGCGTQTMGRSATSTSTQMGRRSWVMGVVASECCATPGSGVRARVGCGTQRRNESATCPSTRETRGSSLLEPGLDAPCSWPSATSFRFRSLRSYKQLTRDGLSPRSGWVTRVCVFVCMSPSPSSLITRQSGL